MLRRTRLFTLLIWLVMVFGGTGALMAGSEPPAGVPQTQLQPELSASGMQRMVKNLQTLDDNIKEAETNLATIDKNLKILQREMEDLGKLEQEHYELKGQYDRYVVEAMKKLTQIETEFQKVSKFQRDMQAAAKKSAPDKAGKAREELERAERDKASLNDWRADANTKIKRVKELLRDISDNLGQVRTRREAVRKDIKVWTDHRKEYEVLLRQYTDQKTQIEKLVQN